jgi:hypothetical protein
LQDLHKADGHAAAGLSDIVALALRDAATGDGLVEVIDFRGKKNIAGGYLIKYQTREYQVRL